MPVTKSAKKKMRQDKKREEENEKVRSLLKSLVKKAKKNPSQKTITDAIKLSDKAAKKHIIHKNKGARIKSALSKLLNQKSIKVKTEKTTSVKPKPKKTPRKKTS